jgi:hypothetical protein
MGFYFTGVIYTLTFGLFFVGWAIDIIRILLWSTVKEPTHSIVGDLTGALGDTIMDSVSSDTREWLERRLWLDKYGRPLLPIGQKSLT